jgi:hypothetical protein
MALGRVERMQIRLTQDEAVAVDDWRLAKRMSSRASAVRELVKRGLVAEGFIRADKNVKSKDFELLATQTTEIDALAAPMSCSAARLDARLANWVLNLCSIRNDSGRHGDN